MPTLKEILPDCDCNRGAPMGRYDTGVKPANERIYDRHVPLNSGGYDRGGAYWGLSNNGNHLRVSFNKSLTYKHFYWTDDEWIENQRCKKLPLSELPLIINIVKYESSNKIIYQRFLRGK